ncbi:MAG: tetratricopeptide repeat protein [Gemmatimonadota bacterium]|nr:tetratricopeptide repeat protein [Gemmatimonadota bacterium]
MSDKLTRKQLKEDHFVDAVMTAWAKAQERPIVAVLALVGVIAIVSIGVRVGREATGAASLNPVAQSALSTARMELAFGRLEEGVESLQAVVQDHPGTEAARESTYLRATALFEAGRFAEAADGFRDFAADPFLDDLLIDGAHLGLAASLEELGDMAAAMEQYLRVWADGKTPATRIDGCLGAARIARSLGDGQRATELLKGLLEAYPNCPEAPVVEYSLAELASSA